MKAIALIVEYNPLHNGHIHHINEAARLFPQAIIIAILNGDFLQRGEPAIVDKYTRARWAIQSGCNLAVELPFAYGTQRADIFATGAIKIASGLGVDAIVYGIEQKLPDNPNLAELAPNQKLGFFYEQAIQKIDPRIQAIAIPRLYSNYADTIPSNKEIASATAVRSLVLAHDSAFSNFIPSYVAADMKKLPFAHIAQYLPLLKYTLLQKNPTALSQFGLHQNTIKELEKAKNFEDFFTAVHHKHTSKTHIQRMLTYMITSITQSMLDEALNSIWTRILAASPSGLSYLRFIKNNKLIGISLIEKSNHLQKPHDMIQYNSVIAYCMLTNQVISDRLSRENSRKITIIVPPSHTTKKE
ncbi:UPF0348 protein [Erysipelotrichaceae bacterium]|nr:UPF0348 protein [Erysipelotrichaceae bacterium]